MGLFDFFFKNKTVVLSEKEAILLKSKVNFLNTFSKFNKEYSLLASSYSSNPVAIMNRVKPLLPRKVQEDLGLFSVTVSKLLKLGDAFKILEKQVKKGSSKALDTFKSTSKNYESFIRINLEASDRLYAELSEIQKALSEHAVNIIPLIEAYHDMLHAASVYLTGLTEAMTDAIASKLKGKQK
jgi:hypothetical protein